MSHVHHQQQAKGDVQEINVYSSTSCSSRPRSSESNLIDVFSSLNQSTSLASYEPYYSSYMADSTFSDDSYHPSEHLSGQQSSRYEDYHYDTSRSNVLHLSHGGSDSSPSGYDNFNRSDHHYVHNSSHTSHSENIDLTDGHESSWDHYVHDEHSPPSGECDRGQGTDSRHHHKSGNNERDHDKSIDITSPGEKHHQSCQDQYVCHEHSPPSGEHDRGQGTDSKHHHKSGSSEHDRDRSMYITSPAEKSRIQSGSLCTL